MALRSMLLVYVVIIIPLFFGPYYAYIQTSPNMSFTFALFLAIVVCPMCALAVPSLLLASPVAPHAYICPTLFAFRILDSRSFLQWAGSCESSLWVCRRG